MDLLSTIVIIIVVGYILKAVYNSQKTVNREWGKGYEVDTAFLNYITPPTIETPDKDTGIFQSLLPSRNKNGMWNLKTDNFDIMNISKERGVNWDCDDLFAIFCGYGKIQVNKDKTGKVYPGWRGIGSSSKVVVNEQVKNISRQNADLKVLLEQSQRQSQSYRKKLLDMEKEIAKSSGIHVINEDSRVEGGDY